MDVVGRPDIDLAEGPLMPSSSKIYNIKLSAYKYTDDRNLIFGLTQTYFPSLANTRCPQ